MCGDNLERRNIMIEGLMQIGAALDTGEDSLVNFINIVEPRRKDKQLNVLKLNFDLDNEKLEIDVLEEMDERSSERYNFIGRFGGPNSAQWYATSSHISYHISETISNLSKLDFGEKLNGEIKLILEKYYYEFDEELPYKYKYAIDIEKYNISNKSMIDILDEAKDKKTALKDVGKEIISIVTKEIENYLKGKYDMSLKEFGLFTIAINGENLAKNDNYIREVMKSKEPKKDNKNLDCGRCSLCQSKEDLTDKINIDIKLYTTNQIIFSSNLDKKNYYKNMQMCKSCVTKYLTGENYIKNNLRTRLGGFDAYIIPQFIYGEPLDKADLDISVEKIVNSFNTVKSLSGIEDMKYDIENTLDMDNRETYFC